MGFTQTELENALEALGTLLASRGHAAGFAMMLAQALAELEKSRDA